MSQPKVFVIMPFAKEFEDLWQLGIRETLTSLGCICDRADAFKQPGFIVSQIHDQILSADLIIAEMTGLNPNVFYEVGWAHALNKPTILCASSSDELSVFDTQAYRHVLHDGQAYILRERLKSIVPEVLKLNARVPLGAELVWAWPSNEYEPPLLEWKANPERCAGRTHLDISGGQAFELTEIGQKILRVQDTTRNWNHIPEWSIITLGRRLPTFKLGDEVIVSMVVRADKEAVIESSGDGTKRAADGSKEWAQGYTVVEKRISSPLWSQILLSSVVKLSKDGQDPTTAGVSAYIRFWTSGSLWVRQIALYRRPASVAGEK